MLPLHPARIALVIISILILAAGVLILMLRHRAGELYRQHVSESRRERLFLAALSFYISFAIVRVVTHAIRAGRGPFHDVQLGGQHIHHLVWGILLLLLVGYYWLLQLGTGRPGGARWAGGMMSVFYGIGAALTLDEYALWLNLQDVYWEREGRASIDAVILFGGLLAIGIWGGPFFHSLVKEAYRIAKQKS